MSLSPFVCGCDANISPQLSEPSFSSPDRSAVTPPPFLKKKTRTKSERYRYQTKDTGDSERYYTSRPWKRKVFDNKWESERGEKEIITR